MTLTEQDLTALRALRQRGFAVCVFEPGEMPHSDPERVEDAMCESGWRQIELDSAQLGPAKDMQRTEAAHAANEED